MILGDDVINSLHYYTNRFEKHTYIHQEFKVPYCKHSIDIMNMIL